MPTRNPKNPVYPDNEANRVIPNESGKIISVRLPTESHLMLQDEDSNLAVNKFKIGKGQTTTFASSVPFEVGNFRKKVLTPAAAPLVIADGEGTRNGEGYSSICTNDPILPHRLKVQVKGDTGIAANYHFDITVPAKKGNTYDPEMDVEC